MNTRYVYEVLLKRESNESQMLLSRLSICSMVNSILLIAFFTAIPTSYFELMKVAFPAIGLAFSIAFVFFLLAGAKAMVSCYNALCKLENSPDFLSIKKEKMRPFIDIAGLSPKPSHWWKIGMFLSPLFPLCFIIIWVLCLFKTLC